MKEYKYIKLYEYFIKDNKPIIVLSIYEIEKILKFKLCKSAYTHSIWWSDDNGRHTQSFAWIKANYQVYKVCIEYKYIVFIKNEIMELL